MKCMYCGHEYKNIDLKNHNYAKKYTHDEYIKYIGFCGAKCWDKNTDDEKHNYKFNRYANIIRKYHNKNI